MAQRRKSSSELVLAEQPANGADLTTPSEPEVMMTAEILPIDSSASDSAASSSFEGQVVGIEKDRIVGWAWNTAKPYEPVDVELYIDALPVGRGSADQFDIDLAKSNLGNGMHRFELSLDRLPTSSPPFVIRAVIAGTEIELLPSISLSRIQDAESLLSGTEYMGKVTGIADGLLCGWVLNWHNPHEEPVLTLRDGDTNVLTRPIKGRTTVVIDTGVTANAYSFELPLPVNILDGKQHFLSVRAGTSGQELQGSPLMFGPADVVSIGQSLAATVEKQQQLDRKLALLQPNIDPAVLERRITGNILDRIDMLLNIHRDAIEREMAILRRQVAELIRLSPDGEPGLIPPVIRARAIEDEQRQAETTLTIMARSAPLVSYDLEAKPESAKPIAGLNWSDAGAPPGVSIMGNGSIELGGVPVGPASLILRGAGAKDPLEFCAIAAAFYGRALTGTVEITETGNWTLIGTTILGPADAKSAKGVAFTYLPNISLPSGALILSQVAVFHRGRVPDRVASLPPQATVLYVGSDRNHDGWYAIETGPRGGLCWMGAQAELTIRVRQTGIYRLKIPEIRPLVPDIMSNLRISLGGVPMSVEFSPGADDPSVFQVVAEARVPEEESSLLPLRLSFPDDCARSPMELGLNDDQRPLTISLRAVALSALDG